MARATIKTDLILAANTQFGKLWEQIDTMTAERQNAEFNFSEDFLQKQKQAHWRRDKNLRDVLIHLYEWHQLLLDWVRSNQNGEQKPFLPAPYNWRTYGQMNLELWEKHQSTDYQEACDMLKQSHAGVMAMIDGFSNEELFTEGGLPCLPGAILGGYCVSATSSHYDWAIKKIKIHVKNNAGRPVH
jgi:hypothetical protein